MSREPSDATKLRSASAKVRQLDAALGSANELTRKLRERATKAEQECAEWKARFDFLLRRDESKKESDHG